MIVIFSTQDDESTNKVIEWLHYYGCHVEIVNELNPIIDISYHTDIMGQTTIDFTLQNGSLIRDHDINIIWYRRGLYFFRFPFTPLQNKDELYPVYQNLRAEYEKLTEAFFHHFADRTIGEPNLSNPNKLIILQEAKKMGLLIPETKIITRAADKLNGAHINKNISEILNFFYKDKILYNRTTLVRKYPRKSFFPSLIQNAIEKEFELRIFFFEDTFFSMAILPANGKELDTDHRDFSSRTYLHRFAFELPVKIKNKLARLAGALGYSTCSIDMIVDKNMDYYFIELNPIGQFGSFSALCGINIEKHIAQKLAHYEKSETGTAWELR